MKSLRFTWLCSVLALVLVACGGNPSVHKNDTGTDNNNMLGAPGDQPDAGTGVDLNVGGMNDGAAGAGDGTGMMQGPGCGNAVLEKSRLDDDFRRLRAPGAQGRRPWATPGYAGGRVPVCCAR